MDYYHVWANKSGEITDLEWVNNMKGFLDHLVNESKIVEYKITRCKMGFASIPDLPEWHIIMTVKSMAQLENAFRRVAPQEGELEEKHKSFNQFVTSIKHAYYSDWPYESLGDG